MRTRATLTLLALLLIAWNLSMAPVPPLDAPAEGEEREHLSGALQALDWWATQRAYPAKEFPARGWAEGYAAARALPEHPAGDKAWNDWQPLGPWNIGGRMVCVVFNPQNPTTIWAGSASGGVWRSFTGGVGVDAWHRVNTGHPVLGVSAVAFAPNDSSTVYIGTGEVYGYGAIGGGIAERITRGSYGIGILKSSDGGETWAESLDWAYDQRRGVQVIKVDPTDADVIWAGTTEGVYKSTDAGTSWTQLLDVIMATDLVIHSGNPDIVVAACGNLQSQGHGLYRTDDGGANWDYLYQPNELPPVYGGKAHLSICASEPDVMMASFGFSSGGQTQTRLCRSEDAGVTWDLRTTVDYSQWQGWFSHDVAMHPQDSSLLMAVGIDIWRSTDGGISLGRRSDWSAWYFGTTPIGGPEGPPDYSHADHHDVVWHPSDPDVVYFANDGGIFRSTDAGFTFAGCNGGLQTTQFYAGFSSSRQDRDVAMGGLQDNSTAIYAGTPAWSRNIGGDGACTGIHAVDDDIMLGSAQYLNMFRSTDGGANWGNVTVGAPGTPSFIAPYDMGGPSDPDVVYAGSPYMVKSVTGGATFTTVNGGSPLNGDPALAIAVSPQDADIVYVTTAPLNYTAGVFRSLDGGATFDDVTGIVPDRYLVGLAVDPTDPMTAYVTVGGFGTPHLYRTRDAGASWEAIGGLPDVPTLAVIVDPERPDHIYVGNDFGVLFSRDDGVSWYHLRGGLGDAVMAMDLTVTPDGLLRLSTYGNGVYERPLEREPTAADDETPAASQVALSLAPNPFNPATVLRYELPWDADVELALFDLRGAHVRTLVRERESAGRHEVRWNGQDAAGHDVPGGCYLARLRCGNLVRTVKMQLVR